MNNILHRDCFVVTPISATTRVPFLERCLHLFGITRPRRQHDEKYWTWFFEEFLQPILVRNEFRVARSIATTGKISKDIVYSLSFADLVVVVLTDNNSNVWWELGVRHTSRLGTVMILEKGQKLPFDVQDYGVIFYDDNNPAAFEAKLKTFLAKWPRKDSPVADFLKADVNFTVNKAIGTLRKTASFLRDLSRTDRANLTDELRQFAGFLPAETQISVVENDYFLFHKDSTAMNPNNCWQNVVRQGESFYAQMRQDKHGCRVGSVSGYENRLTVLAYETLDHRNLLIVVESHFDQSGKRPYDE